METNVNELHSQEFLVYHKQEFFNAIKNNEIEVVKVFLDKGINVNLQDENYYRTALIWAAIKGHEQIVEILLKVKNIDVNLPDDYNRTAFIWATKKNHKKIVEMLVKVEGIDLTDEITTAKPRLSKILIQIIKIFGKCF